MNVTVRIFQDLDGNSNENIDTIVTFVKSK